MGVFENNMGNRDGPGSGTSLICSRYKTFQLASRCATTTVHDLPSFTSIAVSFVMEARVLVAAPAHLLA